MNNVADLMQALSDAGAPMEAIILAVRALEEKDAEIERRRAVERERKRRQRDKDRDGDVNVTGQSRDSHGIVPAHVPDAPPSLSPNENNSNPHTHTPGDISLRARKDDFPKPDWADAQVWADFLKNRKAKRLPNTATAHAKFLTDIAKLSAETGWPPGECLRACVARGWGAIFDPREGSNGRSGQNIGRAQGRRDGVARALDRQLGLDDPPFDRRPTGGSGESGGGPVARLTAVR